LVCKVKESMWLHPMIKNRKKNLTLPSSNSITEEKDLYFRIRNTTMNLSHWEREKDKRETHWEDRERKRVAKSSKERERDMWLSSFLSLTSLPIWLMVERTQRRNSFSFVLEVD
jgi:hypothetical protein